MTEDSLQYITELGWDSFFRKHFKLWEMPGFVPARVVSERKNSYRVCSQYGELSAKISGKMRYEVETGEQYPAVGDWVVIKPQPDEQKGVIQAILPRKSKFSRKVAGARTEEQVVAANVDTVFIVSGLDGGRNFNLRRIERYITLARNSGAMPVAVLNKTDLCVYIDVYIRSIEPVAQGVPIHPVSATERIGLDVLRRYLTRGKTAAFLGPSGVGKSTIINALLGVERQETGEIRESDRRGRHITTRRELILLPSGGAVIDTPGMREIQLWADEDDLKEAFQDIEELAKKCCFNDCQHHTEPGCAVKAAIQRGDLDAARLESYHKLQSELRYLVARENHGTRLEERAKWKKISQWSKERRKHI